MWPDERVVRFVEQSFVPARVHVKEQAEDFKRLGQRFNALWTPTQLILEPDGTERHRIEGFLPADDLLAELTLGLGKAAFARQKWDEAEKYFRSVVEQFPNASAAPQAMYWAGVARYKRTNDAEVLGETGRELTSRHPDSEWAKRASVWLPQPAGTR